LASQGDIVPQAASLVCWRAGRQHRRWFWARARSPALHVVVGSIKGRLRMPHSGVDPPDRRRCPCPCCCCCWRRCCYRHERQRRRLWHRHWRKARRPARSTSCEWEHSAGCRRRQRRWRRSSTGSGDGSIRCAPATAGGRGARRRVARAAGPRIRRAHVVRVGQREDGQKKEQEPPDRHARLHTQFDGSWGRF